RLSRVARGEAPPGLIESSLRRTVGGNVPHRHPAELLQPEGGAGIKLHDLHVLLDEGDEWPQHPAIGATLVKLPWRPLRCRSHARAELEQAREQPPGHVSCAMAAAARAIGSSPLISPNFAF